MGQNSVPKLSELHKLACKWGDEVNIVFLPTNQTDMGADKDNRSKKQ